MFACADKCAGCTSAQRIVADLIPRYASFCPTALETAAKAVIDMHNCNLASINRGEDADGVAFQTAKACIFGLADICSVSSTEAPISSILKGICSAVFRNALVFFISSLDGNSIFNIVDQEVLKLLDSDDNFTGLKQKFCDEDESSPIKLSKLRILSLLHIFICCPKNLLAACFELFRPSVQNGIHQGEYLLSQITSSLEKDVVRPPEIKGDLLTSGETSTRSKDDSNEENSAGKHVSVPAPTCPERCLLGMVILLVFALIFIY